MTIGNLGDDDIKAILGRHLTPSDTIKSPERLFGRHKSLQIIDRALSSPGRQIFIYGDRGVGKTSLALTAAYLHTSANADPILVNCGSATGFEDVVQSIGRQALPPTAAFEKTTTRAFGGSLMGNGVNIGPKSNTEFNIPRPQNLAEALEIVRYVESRSAGAKRVVIVDEMERLNDPHDRMKFAEFIKGVPTASDRIRFIFCGIGNDIQEILGAHPSTGRTFEPVELSSLRHDELWKIITTTADELGVTVDRDKLIRIGVISDGFPHYVHLIGESLFWAAADDEDQISAVRSEHFKEAISTALRRTEPLLKAQFNQATKKTKNTNDYEEALWSLADRSSDRRQLGDIYEQSYSRIMLARGESRVQISKEKLNQRLLSLRKASHGHIVVGYGAGWFGFRENIMRGYVRLDAESNGVQLGGS
ncbi:ATP-binding protein [Mesorhizobium sp. BR1-1-16]|uniref:AAA family ATPase n=1 Tax=Mesorhizobium sp. BR1-1-16 TaxID=2876653 RepID=UPI001CCE0407|nr:ATP-binding protein [Mesorhizobium sp. BR1-1-16]MBZ9938471.1 ATP-binding protein [Mesorhizobium sp. BR1-1-16]